jgi:hypothetical protein
MRQNDQVVPTPRAAAYRQIDIVPIGEGDSVPVERQITTLEGPKRIVGPEHAMGGESSLCGVPKDQLEVVRHLFRSDGDNACQTCEEMTRTDQS